MIFRFYSRIGDFFLKPYQDRQDEERKRVESLVGILATIAIGCLLLSFIIVYVEVRYITGGISLLFIIFLLLVRARKARIVGFLVGPILSTLFISVIFIQPYEVGFELYMLGSLSLFAIILTSLIASSGLQPMVCMFISTGGLLADYFIRVLPGQIAMNGNLCIDDLIINLVLGWVAAGVTAVLIRRSRRLIRQAEMEAAKSQSSLSSLERAIQASSASLNLGSRLNESSVLTSKLIDEMQASLDAAKERMGFLDSQAQNLSGSLQEIASGSASLRVNSDDQSAVVTEASAAIEEMTASIKNISSITNSRREAISQLTGSTEDGRREMEKSTQAVHEMEASASSILDIATVINSVAAQTNLLAMNAAIEAAHAGEYGRGFSVVADEIRKLSEQTGKNVKAVTVTIKETNKAMADVAAANDSARSIFGRISEEATIVAGAMEEIIQGLNEVAGGTAEIMRGVEASVSSTNQVKASVDTVDNRIAEAVDALKELTQASALTLENMESVRSRFVGIAQEAAKVSEIGLNNEVGLRVLQEALTKGADKT